MHPETEAKAKTLALRTKAKDACSLSKDHVAIHFADNTHLTYYFSIHSFITENRMDTRLGLKNTMSLRDIFNDNFNKNRPIIIH